MQQVSQFSVFGFNTEKQDIINSAIYIMINYSILSGALICMQCDIDIQKSQLEFIAHGVSISALILKSIKIVHVSEVNISFRFQSNFSSGIINQINQTLSSFMIVQSIITGYNQFQSASNGYICSKMYVDINIIIVSLSVCIENMYKFGSSFFIATQTQEETLRCADICKTPNLYITYGICLQQLQFSTILSNSTVICEHPFIFNSQNNSCECDFGFFLNISQCVNVIDQFSDTQKNATIMENELRTEIQKSELELKTAFRGLEQLIIDNITEFVKNMNANDLVINSNIISTNLTLHNNINDFRIQNLNQYNTMTGQIENKHIQVTNIINTQFNGIISLINNNQVNIKNNFTAQKDQITELATTINTRFTTLDSSVSSANMKLEALKTQLTGSQTSIESKISGVSTQISNTVSTQQYLKDVYNSLLSAVNGIAAAQDPCKQWPGSVNQNGLCRCQYINSDNSVFCPGYNKCCYLYSASSSSNEYIYKCYGMVNQRLSDMCPGARSYANIGV
ncbi:Hypothetical_protein [Hexamita inflata]|uniref:Hypothetical_protein n=1 Tax=Hexamita inflata TaxID=28002 RepID=A0AA86UHE2_9EUKA|nr:Hypothetical protein HINF_LOCUS43499 [Hexamita inflata]